MSEFVSDCRKEWRRLCVPDAVANEMASDLAADLAEAEAEGVAPEEVLGNGIFDARAFAASWAAARGVVPSTPRTWREIRRRGWMTVAGASVSVLAALAGLALLSHRHAASVAPGMLRRFIAGPLFVPRPLVIGPGPGGVLLMNGRSDLLGLILLIVGLGGSCLTLWLWHPWTSARRRSATEDNAGIPSYL